MSDSNDKKDGNDENEGFAGNSESKKTLDGNANIPGKKGGKFFLITVVSILLIGILLYLTFGSTGQKKQESSSTPKPLPGDRETPDVKSTGDDFGKFSDCNFNCKKIGTALEMYSTDNSGHYPKSLTQLEPKYLPSIPPCPAAGKETYCSSYTSNTHPDSYTFYCKGHYHSGAGVGQDKPYYSSTSGLTAKTDPAACYKSRAIFTIAEEAPDIERESYVSDPSKSGFAPRYRSDKNSVKHGGPANIAETSVPPELASGQKPEKPDDMFFKKYGTNPFVDTEDDHFSTFSIDVDTASYTLMRKYLNDGNLPDDAAVRVEEFINYFRYGYPAPDKGDFAVHMEAAPSIFGQNCDLFRVGIKGREIRKRDRKRVVLTFVIDVSGSMESGDRLGLVKRSLKLLVNELQQGDMVGIVIYGDTAGVVLNHTGIEHRSEILAAIESLQTDGATNADEGLKVGYKLANKDFDRNAINRVILCSDGVANVGETGPEAILKKIEEYAREGIFLTTVGFGMGNYNDELMEKLADKGNGNYAYVDDMGEARKLFVEKLTGTLEVIARDVKIQVDFDPKVVRSYRLLGYENRDIADQDFRNDKVDAGEVGAGHSVTALYEVKLHPGKTGDMATVFIRYKAPDSNKVTEFNRKYNTGEIKKSFDEASDSFKLASATAEFAEILRKSYWAKDGDLDKVLKVVKSLGANQADNPDVKELINLIATAKKLRKSE